MNELRDQIKDKETELQSYLRRKSNEETDFELIEKRRFEKIQSDLDSISKEYRVLEVERNSDREKHLEQFGRLEGNYNNRWEENRRLKKKIEELEKKRINFC